MASVRRIAVQPDGSANIVAKPVQRRIFSNAALLQQVASVAQVVNNGEDGDGAVVGATRPRRSHPPPPAAPSAADGAEGSRTRAVSAVNRLSCTGALLKPGETADLTSHEELTSRYVSGRIEPQEIEPRETQTSRPRPGCVAERCSEDVRALSLGRAGPLTVVIFGATGDLARKKLFPALYQVGADCLLLPLQLPSCLRNSVTGTHLPPCDITDCL